MRDLAAHLDPTVTPKRMLALDGGGVRGLISLGILKRIEAELGSPLSNHFDLIGGTSTGALIATKLSTGSSVDEIARALGTSPRTVKRRWRFVRAWLQRHMLEDES